MANINDYIKKYCDKTFEEFSFNDLDALVFSELAYVDLNGCFDYMPISLEEVGNVFFLQDHIFRSRFKAFREPQNLFEIVYKTNRYKDILITNYRSITDSEKQFRAITFKYREKFTFIAFEGTDASIVGWKEDFELSHTFPIPSQKKAIDYIEKEIRLLDRNVYVGGHSKGGNLAIVASLKANILAQAKVKAIYSFDGPGLRDIEYNSMAYRRIRKKIKHFIPEESIIGLIFKHDSKYKVVKSGKKGILQHDPFTWECLDGYFKEGKLSNKSLVFEKSMEEFLKDIPNDERIEFVDTLFELFEKAGIKSAETVTLGNILKCGKYIGVITTSKIVKDKLKKMFDIFIKVYSTK